MMEPIMSDTNRMREAGELYEGMEVVTDIHIRRLDIERFMMATKTLSSMFELNKKRRVIIDYDPEKATVTFLILKDLECSQKE